MGTEDSPTTTTSPNGSAEAPTDLELKVIRQIEYYFGDYNLSKDRFLQEKSKADDGWIPLDTMVTFNRLKELTTDFEVIGTALKKSPNQLMEVSEDGKKIRRSPDKPVPEFSDEARADFSERTLYVKGFPDSTPLDVLIEFFKNYGNVVNVFMKRKRPNKAFKGSVFVTFATKEEAEKVLKFEDLKYNEKALNCEKKEDYVKRKSEEYHKRLEDKAKLKAQKAAMTEDVADKEEEGEEEEEIKAYPKGCLLKLSGLSEQTMWEHLKDVFSPHAKIAFVDYSRGKPEGIIRFEEGDAAKALEEALEGKEKKLVILGKEVTGAVLEGDDELTFWKKLYKSKEERKHRPKGRKQKGRGQGRGAHKRPADTRTEEPPAKEAKTEAGDN